MITLQNSSVRLDQEQHHCFIGVEELSGVTGFLKKLAFTDKYRGIPQWILDRAALNGALIYESVRLLGGGFPSAKISDGLKGYQRIKKENSLTIVTNEYIVTDKEHFTSGIDLVLANNKGEIILVNVKTASILDKKHTSW